MWSAGCFKRCQKVSRVATQSIKAWDGKKLILLLSAHPPRKDPIGHTPVPEENKWEKLPKIFPWNGMAMSPAFKHLSNERSSRRSASPLTKGDSHPGIIYYYTIHFYKLKVNLIAK